MDETKGEASNYTADKVSCYTYYYYLNIETKNDCHSLLLPKRDMMRWSNNEALQQEVALLAECNVRDALFTQQKKTQAPNNLFIFCGVFFKLIRK